ncbi:MAG: putative Ig domain-containing protein [Polyangiaceae bacterium]
MIAFRGAAAAAKVAFLLTALATLAACAGDDSDDTPGSPSSSSRGAGGSADGGSGAEGGSGGSSSVGAQGGGGGVDPGPCGQDCSVFGPPGDPCYIGVCNTGEYPGPINVCAVVPAPQGTECEDGLFCTAGDTCDQGTCQAGPPNTCDLTLEACSSIACDETTKACTQAPAGEGSACVLDGSDKCEVNGACTAGACVGVPKDCTFSPLTECNVVACNPANGLCEGTPDATKEGTACSLTGDLCQSAKTCQAGACSGGTPKDCSDLSVGCNNGVCNANSGFCEAEPVPAGGTCAEGSDECNTGICDANATCVPTPKANGTPCNDFSTCTDSDTCSAGVCDGTTVAGCLYYLQSPFEACPENWTMTGDWECGPPTKAGAAPHGGTGVLVTKLATPYSNGNAWANNVAADSPVINLTDAVEPMLEFYGWVRTESTLDGVNLKVSTDNGVTYNLIPDVSPAYNITADGQPAWGNNLEALGWRRYVVDLGAFVGQQIKLRFHFRTDGSIVYPGMYIDDLAVGEAAVFQLEIQEGPLGAGIVGQPYTAPLARVGGSSNAEWSIVGGTNHGWLTIDPATGALSGTPGPANTGPVSITVRVEEPSLPTNFDEATFTFSVITAAYWENFEGGCPSAWTFTGEWECGTPTVIGPAAAYSGVQCIGTDLDDTYGVNIDWGTMSATSPDIDLAGTTAPILMFRAWVHTEGSLFDGFNVKVSSGGGAFGLVSAVTPAYPLTIDTQGAWGGDQSGLGWQLFQANLAAFAGQTIKVQFDFTADGSIQKPGVYIDDVVVGE